MTPEEHAREIILAVVDASYAPDARPEAPIAIVCRALDERAAQERERIIDEVVRPLGWRDDATDGMRVAVTTIIAAIRAL